MSRLNALTHGLCASLPLSAAEHDAYARSLDRWTRELAPCCEAEDALVRRAAISALRLDRCTLAEEAALALAARKAEARLLARRRRAARKAAQSLEKDPADTVEALRSTPEGCDWLIARWAEVDAQLAQGVSPWPSLSSRIFHLLGSSPGTAGAGGPPPDPDLWWLIVFCEPDDQVAGTLIRQSRRAGLEPPTAFPEPDDARLRLRRKIAGYISELRSAHASALSSASELRDAELLCARANALVDTSPAALLRHRYARDAQRSYDHSLSLLLRIRQDRRRSDLEAHRASRSTTPAPSTPAMPPRNEPATPPTTHDATPSNANQLPPPDATPPPIPSQRTDTETTPSRAFFTPFEPPFDPAPINAPLNPPTPHPLR